MSHNSFVSVPMDQLNRVGIKSAADWLWHGYLARGSLTLLTSVWKAGKTTLLTGLLQRLGDGQPFLGRDCATARSLVVSEESPELWSARTATMPVGRQARLVLRPFENRPTPADWRALVDHALDLRAAGEIDLFVVDPLVTFLPGHSECDAGTLLEMLQPLQRLASAGAAVLILHHPRKKPAEEGHGARGSGALLGFVDVILEMHKFGRLQSDERRRRLVGLSRHAETPRVLAYEWDPATGVFSAVTDLTERRYQENWERVRAILAKQQSAVTHQELLDNWPADLDRPSASVLYGWLNRAFEEKRCRRSGRGLRTDPYRYRLENADDKYYDRGLLPPLRDLDFLPPTPQHKKKPGG
jgi:RecA-family ATPase